MKISLPVIGVKKSQKFITTVDAKYNPNLLSMQKRKDETTTDLAVALRLKNAIVLTQFVRFFLTAENCDVLKIIMLFKNEYWFNLAEDRKSAISRKISKKLDAQ